MVLELKFKNVKPVLEKLLEFGFVKKDNELRYETNLSNDLLLVIKIIKEDIIVDVIDLITNDKYIPFYVSKTHESFLSNLQMQIDKILDEVLKNCFISSNKEEININLIISYVKEKYGDNPEYLWEKTPDCFIIRNKKNKKWYLAILSAKKRTIGINADGDIMLINLMLDSKKINGKIDNKNYFSAYHMNKKNWISARLDTNIDIKDIYNLIDESYNIVDNKKI